jgi:tetratricopeptide (TPR) repeat protein
MMTGRVPQVFGIVSVLLSTAVAGKMCLATDIPQDSNRSSYWDGIERIQRLNTEMDEVMRRDAATIAAYNRGLAAYYRGGASDYQEAETAFREAATLKPAQAVYHYALGDALLAQGKYADAEASFVAARDRDATVSAYDYGVGIAQLWQEKNADAERSFLAARDKDGTVAANHYALAYTQLVQSKYADAEPAFRRAAELDKGAESYYGMGLALLEQQKNEEAALAFQSAIDTKPDVASYHAALGFARTYQGRYADADAAFRAATRIDPTVPVLQPQPNRGTSPAGTAPGEPAPTR